MATREIPTINDFAVVVRDDGILEMTSASRGTLASFPAWEHADRDLRHFTAHDVPFGSIDEPYDDRDDAWRIVIYEDEGFVYVAEGDDPRKDEFARVFRVARDRYFTAWTAVIDQFNPIRSLDEALGADSDDDETEN